MRLNTVTLKISKVVLYKNCDILNKGQNIAPKDLHIKQTKFINGYKMKAF